MAREGAPRPAQKPETKAESKAPDPVIGADTAKKAPEAPKAADVKAPQDPKPGSHRGFHERAESTRLYKAVDWTVRRITPLDRGIDKLQQGIVKFQARNMGFYDKRFQKANEKAAGAAVQYKASEAEILRLEASLKADEERMKLVPEGTTNPKLAIERERNRVQLERQMEVAKNKRDRLAQRLEQYNHKKSTWENRQALLAKDSLQRIQEISSPYRKTFESLKARREEHTAKIETIKQQQEKIRKTIEEHKKNLSAAGLWWGKKKLQGKISAFEKDLWALEKRKGGHIKKQTLLEGKMAKAHSPLGKWHVLENEFTRVLQRERRYTYPKAAISEEADFTPAAYSFSEGRFENLEITPRKYIDAWSKAFKTPLPPQIFERIIKGFDPDTAVSAMKAEDMVRNFFNALRGGKIANAPTKEDIERGFKKLRSILETEKS